MSASGDLQVYIVEFLTARGWTVWRNNSGQIKTGAYMVRLSPENSGDIIGYDILGRYVHIEEKIGNDILSPGQVEEMAKVAESKHGIAGLITDKKQFEAWYDNIQKKNTLPSGEERKCPKCHKMVVPRYATENYGVMGWAVCPRCNTNRHKTDWDGRNDGGMGR